MLKLVQPTQLHSAHFTTISSAKAAQAAARQLKRLSAAIIFLQWEQQQHKESRWAGRRGGQSADLAV